MAESAIKGGTEPCPRPRPNPPPPPPPSPFPSPRRAPCPAPNGWLAAPPETLEATPPGEKVREIKGGSPQGQTVRACEGAQGLATAGAGLRDAATGPRGRTAAERPRAVHAPSGRCPLMGVAAAAAATASPHALSTKVRSNTPWAALKGGTGRGGGGGDEGLARVTHGAGLRGAAGAPRQKPASCGAGKCARTRAPYLDAAGDSEVPEKPQRAEPAGGGRPVPAPFRTQGGAATAPATEVAWRKPPR